MCCWCTDGYFSIPFNIHKGRTKFEIVFLTPNIISQRLLDRCHKEGDDSNIWWILSESQNSINDGHFYGRSIYVYAVY